MTDHKHTDRDGFAKHLERMRGELAIVAELWKVERAEQDGWSHQYMQHWRTFARNAPITSATLLGVGGPVMIVVAVVLAIL